MSTLIQKPTLMHRIRPVVAGMDLPLLLGFAMLAGLGLLIMYSSGYDHGERFYDHGRNLLLSLGIMLVVAQVPLPYIMRAALPLYAVGVVLLLAVAAFGITRKGSTRWLNLGVVIQPSELMKIAMPLMLAWWFQMREGSLRFWDFVAAFVILLVPFALIAKQPDLGTGLLVLSGGLLVIYFAGLRWRWILPVFVLGGIGISLMVFFGDPLCADGVNWHVLKEYQRQRVCTLLDPTRDPLGKGFHIIQGMIAIGAGGFWGKGFMQGTQTHLEFIPERTTDFIFAAYSEEFGLVGNLLLIGTFAFIVYRGLVIAQHAPTLFARLMAATIAILFFFYAFVNMGMVSGILPVVGVPLPYVSYGGTAMITLGFALGILQAISKAKKIIQS
ncbi:MAG: rod shape-determining protein RodA [Brachymonas sp.]